MKIVNNQTRSYSYDEKSPVYAGTNSKVFYAMDETFGRRVCLKIIPYGNDAGAEIRLKAEVIALAKAGEATNRVPVLLDFWADSSAKEFYIIMQLISGDTLRKRFSTANRYNFNNWMISVCDILTAVHNMHIQHKDIKPENIVITANGDAYLIDFNISITKSNLKEGTEFYRAPEMYQTGVSVSRNQSDIFSLGVIMYEYYTGTLPSEGINYGTEMFQMDNSVWGYFTPPSAIVLDMPKALNDIIEKCMKRSPEQRYRQVSDLKRDLIKFSKENRGWIR